MLFDPAGSKDVWITFGWLSVFEPMMRGTVDPTGAVVMTMFDDEGAASTVERMVGVLLPAVIRITEPVAVGRGVGGAIAICVVGFDATSVDAVGGEDSPTIRNVLLPVLDATGMKSGGSPRLAPRLIRVGAMGCAAGLAFAKAAGRAMGWGGGLMEGRLAGCDGAAANGWAAGVELSTCGCAACGAFFAVTYGFSIIGACDIELEM